MTKPKVLLHICCAPCALYPLKSLREEGFSVYGFWFNPNIHPFAEHQKRLDEVLRLCEEENVELIEAGGYPVEAFFRRMAFRENVRCPLCYNMRLEKTAAIARKGKFDFFTTTLLYSKFQKHDAICIQGEAAAKMYGRKFLYRDFREGWSYGVDESKKRSFYRQQYCGCLYSEKERYRSKIGKKKEEL
ncbi:MAG TPA: epoxyqueuosine reductase QueH [Firmicutes bacterium]|nr:epoxyqueuosine reductase QueH [Bacillota bacterium]